MSAPAITIDFPHEADPAVPTNTVSSVGPTGTTLLVQAACLHCRQWFPVGSDRRCAHHAYAAAQAAK